MHYSLVKTLEATAEPISLAEAKAQLRVDFSDATNDALIQAIITAARSYVESFTGRQLMTCTYSFGADYFPTVASQFLRFYDIRLWDLVQNFNPLTIVLPRHPVQSISSISYLDASGNTQTLNPADPTQVLIDLNSYPARLAPPLDGVWPTTQDPTGLQCVTIVFIAGFAGGPPNNSGVPVLNQIPGEIMAAMRYLIAEMYEERKVSVESRLAESPVFKYLLYSQRLWQCP